MSRLVDLPLEWDAGDKDDLLEPGAVSYIRFIGKKLFDDYEPRQFQPFEMQLLNWLNNVPSFEDKKTLFSILNDLFFVGRKEYAALYRSAYNGAISSWIIDVCGLSLFSADIDATIRRELNSSWICPLTDSLRINAFLKTNNIVSQSLRPDWISLKKFGDVTKIRDYVSTGSIRNIIILEDFVGSGAQAKRVLPFAAESLESCNILFVPLVVCPQGDEKIQELVVRYGNLRYSPQLVLPNQSMLRPDPAPGEPSRHVRARELFDRLSSEFSLPQHETMYGFKSTGSQVVTHTNCPNNTLQVYHFESEKWTPLFPRVRRVI